MIASLRLSGFIVSMPFLGVRASLPAVWSLVERDACAKHAWCHIYMKREREREREKTSYMMLPCMMLPRMRVPY